MKLFPAAPPAGAIRQDSEQLCAILDWASDGIVVCDLAGAIVEANDTVCSMFETTRPEIAGRSLVGLASAAADPRSDALAWLASAPLGSAETFEWRHVLSSGRNFWIEAALRRIALAGQPFGLALLRDVTTRKLAEERLAREMRRDLLTGLPNRRDLDEILQHEIARYERYGGYLCVALGDFDDFAALDEADGETLLTKTADFLRGRLRKSDYLAHRGAGEFAFLIHDAKPDAAARMLNRLRNGMANEIGRARTLSFGLTGYTLSDTADLLLSRATNALSVAKKSGFEKVVAA